MDPLVKSHARLDFGGERVLHVAEEVSGACESNGHGAELAGVLCHFLTLVRFWVAGMLANILAKRSTP